MIFLNFYFFLDRSWADSSRGCGLFSMLSSGLGLFASFRALPRLPRPRQLALPRPTLRPPAPAQPSRPSALPRPTLRPPAPAQPSRPSARQLALARPPSLPDPPPDKSPPALSCLPPALGSISRPSGLTSCRGCRFYRRKSGFHVLISEIFVSLSL